MTGPLRDRDWFEQQYNPRLTVTDVQGIFDRWTAVSAATRKGRPCRLDLPYGPHPREVIDLFPADRPRGALVFLHGGYWRALSTKEHSFVAPAWLEAGFSVFLVNYPLCPQVTIKDIVASCRRAMATLWPMLGEAERRHVLVAGHSAGGYLAAAMAATDWAAPGLPAVALSGALSLSGVFDLPPLLNTSMNELIRLTPETARDWSLTRAAPATTVPLSLALGADEPGEFHRQSFALAEAWHMPAGSVQALAGHNHFTIVEDFADPAGRSFALAMQRVGLAPTD
ncbi:MAG TPA: alpha/beta hydrolase [Beijerinckiaceae bacterium]|nr:alpha/beta hydrolase [Beijerinckiaceae bacterium]